MSFLGALFWAFDMDTFTWLPDRDYDTETDTGVLTVQFGDGVTQIQQRFIGKPKREFSLKFERATQTVDQIEAFLLKQRGRRFLWQQPSGGVVKVRCPKWKRQTSGFVDSVSCTFTEEH